MPVLIGELEQITGSPSSVTQVMVRAHETRITGSALTTDELVPIPVDRQGRFEVPLRPGKAVLVLVHGGRVGEGERFPLLVEEGLGTITSAIKLASDRFDDYEINELEQAAADMLAHIDKAAVSATQATVSKEAAKKERVDAEKARQGAETIEQGLPGKVNQAITTQLPGELDDRVPPAVADALSKDRAVADAAAAAVGAEAKDFTGTYEGRITSLEAMGGIAPQAPVDGQTANLVAQPATLTRTTLDGNFANDDPLHILYRSGRALRKVHAALERRNEKTCRIVFLGSSTTAGFNATNEYGYVSHFTERIQAVYPSSTGVEIPMGTRAGQYQPSEAPGVQVVNMGGGGSHSGNYLLAGVVGALKPDVAIHMVGSNDWNTNVEPSTYRTNMENAIATIDSRNGFRCVHIFIHQHERHQYTPRAYPFSAYRDVLRDIALADPDYVMLIDLTAEFRRLGIPEPNPFVLLDTDRIHLTDRGHQFLTEALFTRLGLPTSKVVGKESAPPPTQTFTMITSDGFGDDSTTLGTRPTDVAHGGSPITPTVVSQSTLKTSGGNLVADGYGTVLWPHTVEDVQVSVKIVQPTAGGPSYLHSRFGGAGGSTQVIVKDSTVAAAVLKVGDVEYGGNKTYSAGDTIAVRSVGDRHELLINGEVRSSAVVPGITTTGSRFNTSAGVTELHLDDLKIEQIS